MASLRFVGPPARILDFDVEARPLSWYAGDLTTREITAIAAKFLDDEEGYVWLLGRDDPERMLEGFRALYDEADIVAGHYIRGYDLPNLMSAYHELGLPGLTQKWAIDTKLDLVKRQGMSNSQENLAAELGIEAPKVQMTQADWREANRLTEYGIALTEQRVTGDVIQHIEMMAELRRRGMLGPGKLWTPEPGNTRRYTP